MEVGIRGKGFWGFFGKGRKGGWGGYLRESKWLEIGVLIKSNLALGSHIFCVWGGGIG